MRTQENRARYNRDHLRYPSDTSQPQGRTRPSIVTGIKCHSSSSENACSHHRWTPWPHNPCPVWKARGEAGYESL
jgi:hypothetical protein